MDLPTFKCLNVLFANFLLYILKIKADEVDDQLGRRPSPPPSPVPATVQCLNITIIKALKESQWLVSGHINLTASYQPEHL